NEQSMPGSTLASQLLRRADKTIRRAASSMETSRPLPGLTAVPRGKRLVVIVWLFVAIVICLLTAAVYSVELLSAGRAFVGAEGHWSRAQKDAVFHLTRFALNPNDADYRSFERAIAVPLGARRARVELTRPEP